MNRFSRAITTFFKNELKVAMSLGVLLIALVSFSLAVGTTYRFDFGDGFGLKSGYLPVDGNATMYPESSGSIQYGWMDSVMEFSDGAAVVDELNRDGNKDVNPARFKVTGLDNGNYRISLVVGSLNNAFATKVTTNGQSFSVISSANQWSNLAFDAEVTAGELLLTFARSGSSLWGVNGMTISPSAAPIVKPTFDVAVQPSAHTVKVGGTAEYRISLNPLNGYASQVELSISGLVGGMSGQFTPAAAIPPMVTSLVIITNPSTPATVYDFVITATGKDSSAFTINKTISLTVTDSPGALITVKPDTVINQPSNNSTNQPGTGPGTLDDVYLTQPKTADDVKTEQKLVDDFANQAAKKLADNKEIQEVKDISTINWFAVPPIEAKTGVEASLQYLTTTGIIGTTVDSAPPGPTPDPKPLGFWERLFKTMVNPTS